MLSVHELIFVQNANFGIVITYEIFTVYFYHLKKKGLLTDFLHLFEA